jgi:hypothetical protein
MAIRCAIQEVNNSHVSEARIDSSFLTESRDLIKGLHFLDGSGHLQPPQPGFLKVSN